MIYDGAGLKSMQGVRGVNQEENWQEESVFYCPDCNVPICLTECLKKFHAQ